jgi:hypothetical protein
MESTSTLREHVIRLERRIQVLNFQLAAPHHSIFERDRIQFELRLVQLALAHYQTGFELERNLVPADSN